MLNNTTIVISPVNTLVLENRNILRLNYSMKLSERLRRARAHAKISQEELALRLNASQSLISKIERGEQEETTLIVKIAKICGVSIEWMDSGEGEMLDGQAYSQSPEALVHAAMQHMDTTTKYQLVKISNSLIEPKANSTEK